jgi:hypothetical protein
MTDKVLKKKVASQLTMVLGAFQKVPKDKAPNDDKGIYFEKAMKDLTELIQRYTKDEPTKTSPPARAESLHESLSEFISVDCYTIEQKDKLKKAAAMLRRDFLTYDCPDCEGRLYFNGEDLVCNRCDTAHDVGAICPGLHTLIDPSPEIEFVLEEDFDE